MTTYPDDTVWLNLAVGTRLFPCQMLGLEWPPPERLTHLNGVELYEPMVRTSMSKISDEARAGMTHVIRGAEYYYEGEVQS